MSEEEKRPEEASEASDAPQASEASAEESKSSEETASSEVNSDDVPTAIPPSAAEAKTEESKKEPAKSEPPKASVAASVATSHADHGHGGHGDHGHGGHGDHGHDGHGHVAPMKLLIGVLGALMVLTIMTVGVTSIDLGTQLNLLVAMIIATVKAALVMGYFMHLAYDHKFNVVVFTSSFLFVILFLSMALLDRQEYQPRIDEFEATAKVQAAN